MQPIQTLHTPTYTNHSSARCRSAIIIYCRYETQNSPCSFSNCVTEVKFVMKHRNGTTMTLFGCNASPTSSSKNRKFLLSENESHGSHTVRTFNENNDPTTMHINGTSDLIAATVCRCICTFHKSQHAEQLYSKRIRSRREDQPTARLRASICLRAM